MAAVAVLVTLRVLALVVRIPEVSVSVPLTKALTLPFSERPVPLLSVTLLNVVDAVPPIVWGVLPMKFTVDDAAVKAVEILLLVQLPLILIIGVPVQV